MNLYIPQQVIVGAAMIFGLVVGMFLGEISEQIEQRKREKRKKKDWREAVDG